MSFNLDPLKKWFGHDRRERRASFILLVITFAVFSVRYLIPPGHDNISELTDELRKEIYAEKLKDSLDESRTAYKANKQTLYKTPGNDRKNLIETGDPQSVKRIDRKLIELNSCDSIQLESLPGIGKVLSKRIIKYRNLLGGFVSVNQLREVYGLPAETFERIRNRVFADSSSVRRVRVNSAPAKELARLPYLKKYDITAILEFRKNSGKISGIDQMTASKVLTAETAAKVKGYLDFR